MMRYNAAMIKPIKTYSLEELQQLMKELGQPAFRAKQLYEWLYLHNASSYDEMTNLPRTLREQLSIDYPLFVSNVADSQTSQDGTTKYVISYHDGARVAGSPCAVQRKLVVPWDVPSALRAKRASPAISRLEK